MFKPCYFGFSVTLSQSTATGCRKQDWTEDNQLGDSRGSDKTWWWVQVGEGSEDGEEWMDGRGS